jgi:uncharacterized membrane protein YfcA
MSALSSLGFAFYAAVLLSAFVVRSAAGFGAGLIAIPMLAFILPVSTAVSVEFLLLQPCSLFLVRRFLHANSKDDQGDRGDSPQA